MRIQKKQLWIVISITVAFWGIFALFKQYTATQPQEASQSILIGNTSKEISTNDLFNEFEYISLETSENSIFGAIDKLIIYDDKYYILDLKTNKIYVFRQDGSFVLTIGSIGKGPGEYTHLADFVIDEEKKRIIILGFYSTIYIYDLNGIFIQQKQLLSSPLWSMCSFRDGFVFSNNHESIGGSLIYIFDNDFNLIGTMGEVLEKGSTLPLFVRQPFLKDGENIAYFDNVHSSICYIHPSNEKTIHFILSTPIPFDAQSDLQKFITNQSNYCFFLNAYWANDIFWASFVNKGKEVILVRDLKNNLQITANSKGWYPRIMSHANGWFYSALDIHWILDEEPPISSAKRVTKYPIDYNSNAVIVRFKPKPIFD